MLKQSLASKPTNVFRMPVSWIPAVLWLILAAALVLCFQGFSHSSSIDFANHGMLVSRLMSGWNLPKPDPFLAEMAIYPRISHQIAAIAGKLSGSAVQGMQQTAIISLFVLWTAIGISFARLPRNQFFVTLGVLTTTSVAGSSLLGVELFGSELLGNYYFAQLVGQAAGMLMLVVALRLEWLAPASIRPIAVLAAFVPLLASVHLLAALELLGTLAMLVGLRAIAPCSGRWTIRNLPGIGVVAASAVLLVANPDFKAMVQISGNNGAIEFHHVSNIPELIALATITTVVSSYMLISWWRGERAGQRHFLHVLFKYFGAFGLATSGLCIVQIIALNLFAMGSHYACFKYVFGMQSMLAIAMALTSAQSIKPSVAMAPTVSRIGGILFAAIVCTTTFQDTSGFRTQALVAAEVDARQFEVGRTNRTPGSFDLALGIEDVPGIGNYFLSRGILGSANDGVSMDVLFSRIPDLPEKVDHILTSPGAVPWDVSACRRGSAGRLVALDANCVYATFGEVTCSGTIEFASQGALDKAISGFSASSADGRWSEGPAATLKCKKPDLAPKVAYINATGLVSSTHSQRMRVSVNGQLPQPVEYSAQMPAWVVEIPLPADASPELVFRFQFPDAISPRELGLNSDERRLAVMVHSVRFE